MVKSLSNKELMTYARLGAEARIAELRAELAALEAAFGSGRGRGDAAAKAPRKRRKISAAARKRIGEAAKKRWAKWRAEKKSGK